MKKQAKPEKTVKTEAPKAEAAPRPTKAQIKEILAEHGGINAKIIIEVQGNDNEYTQNALKEIVVRMQKEKGLKVYDTIYSTPIRIGEEKVTNDWFSTHAEIFFVAKDFSNLVQVALMYSPSSIEIFEPSKFEISSGEAQAVMSDISNLVTTLAHAVHAHRGMINKLKAEAEKK